MMANQPISEGDGVLRVAIGDPDPTFARALSNLIEDAGLVCIGTAATAWSLLSLVGGHDVDVIAMDVRLPGLHTVVDSVRALGRDCRLVAMAALVTPATRAMALDVGLPPIVSKLHGEALLAAIAAL